MAVQTDHSQTTSQPHSTLPFTELHMAACREGKEGGTEGKHQRERKEARTTGWMMAGVKNEEGKE